MIWQEKSQVILMITHEEEKGRVKCARYWPEPPHSELLDVHETPAQTYNVYNDINVTFIKLIKLSPDFLLREFRLTKLPKGGNDSTTSTKATEHNSFPVYQFQYLAWSDHGVPDNVQNTISFIEHVNQMYKKIGTSAPITVHCRYRLNYFFFVYFFFCSIIRLNIFP